jgi:hypothetical protein
MEEMMTWLAVSFIFVAFVLFWVYVVIGMLSGIKPRQISFWHRVVAVVAVNASFLFGGIGWWLLSSVGVDALLIIIPVAILFGILGGWGLLAGKGPSKT